MAGDLLEREEKNSDSKDDERSDSSSVCDFEAALEEAGTGKFHWFLLLICGGCLMTVIVETLNIGFVIPMSECDLHLTLSDKGLLNGSAFLGVVVSAHFWGFLADTWGRRKVLLLCTFFACIFSVISSFSVTTWMLISTRFLVGLFISACASNTYAYLGEFHTEKGRAMALSFAGTFMAFAMTFCPFIAWMIALMPSKSVYIEALDFDYSIWRIFLFFCASLDGLVSLGLLFLPESPKFYLVHREHDKAIDVMSTIFNRNKNLPKYDYPVTKISLNENYTHSTERKPIFLKLMWTQTVPLFKSPFLFNTIRTSFLMFSLFAASSGFYMWTPDILNTMMKSNNTDSTVCSVIDDVVRKRDAESSDSSCNQQVDVMVYKLTFAMGIVFSVVYFLNGLVINKLGKKNLLSFWFLVCGVCCVLLTWASTYNLIIFLMVTFLILGVCGSILSVILVDIYPTNIRAMALSLILLIGRIGAIFGGNFIAFFIIRSCSFLFISMGIFTIIGAVIGFFLPH